MDHCTVLCLHLLRKPPEHKHKHVAHAHLNQCTFNVHPHKYRQMTELVVDHQSKHRSFAA